MATPPHELARLDALARSHILDTPAEPEFDDLVRLAAAATRCPVAMLCFVDEHRLWFKATYGIDTRELPRGGSACTLAIDSEQPYVVPDVTKDPRVAHHPLVVEPPHARAYAAVRLLDGEHALGTLAVLDTQPRQFTQEQLALLQALARTAIALLDRRRLRETRLLRSEAMLLSATRISGIGCWQWNMETGEITWSDETRTIFGMPDDFQPSLTCFEERLHPDDRAIVAERTRLTLEGKMTTFPDYRILRPTGETRIVQATAELERDHSGRPILLTGALLDITDRRRVEEESKQLAMQVMHGQKLESLGVLAAGVAHDFNNLLVGMLGNAELVAVDPALSGDSRELIGHVVEAASQAAGLTRQLLAYTGRGHIETAEVDLSALVTPIVEILRASIPKSVVLTAALPARLPAIRADADQLQQVAMNLIMNSAEAYGSASGEVRIRTFAALVEGPERHDLTAPTSLSPGPYVVLEVMDRGGGMTRATLDRVFEPFFTTKFTGRGLGLAAVLGIARSHGAVLTVDSEPGHGSRFRVHLPALDHLPLEQAAPTRPRSDAEALRGRTVLLVDDEPRVRALERRVLCDAGMNVLEASDGAEAISLLQRHEHLVDVVVLDLVMPGLDSATTLRRLRGLRSDLPALVQSGYPEEEATARMQEIVGKLAFLQKPFSPKALVARLSDLLRSVAK